MKILISGCSFTQWPEYPGGPNTCWPKYITGHEITNIGEAAAAAKLERAVASIIEEGKFVTYDMKPDRNDPTAVGTREMAEAICKRMAELG